MGLLDDLSTHVPQPAGAAVAGGASHSDILGAITHLLGGQGGIGGLAGLVQLFNQGGLGHIIQSWISTGQNLPISPAQLQQVLGQGNLQGLAAKVGVSPDVLGQQLSHVLPTVVDKLTPGGQLPSQDSLAGLGGLGDALGALKKLL
jgi:uncharacterized protein YidB (DUF937 family)